MHRIPTEYVGMPVKLNLRRLKRKKHHLYARSARSERTIMSINPDEIVEGKCHRAVMIEGPVIFKVTEIKPSAVNATEKDRSGATSSAQNRRTVFWVSRSVAKNSRWTKIPRPCPMRHFAIAIDQESPAIVLVKLYRETDPT